MKSSMKKFFVTCAAVSAVSVCAAASAMAADFTQAPTYSDDDTNTVTIVVPADIDAEKQATVLVVPKDKVNEVTDEDILYINQGLTSDNGMTTLKLKGTSKLEDGTYTVKFGGYVGETFTLYSGDFTVGDAGRTILVGDANQSKDITSADASLILTCVSDEEGLDEGTDAYIAAAKSNGEDDLTSGDASAILSYLSDEEHDFVGNTITVD